MIQIRLVKNVERLTVELELISNLVTVRALKKLA